MSDLLLGFIFLCASCIALSYGTATSSSRAWGYKRTTDRELGPADWKIDYPACGGRHQSPINIPMRAMSIQLWDDDRPPLEYRGACEKFTLRKLEDLYKWEIHPDEHCTVKSANFHEREYTLLQFHMHATSEHSVNGTHYDAELHFVHQAVDGSGKLLVMGVFLHAAKELSGKQNSFVQNLLGDMEKSDETLDLDDSNTTYAELLNDLVGNSHLVNYSGSLTTPPCSEIVDWWVLSNPILISFNDLEKMKKLYGALPSTNNSSDNRLIQPRNDRNIRYYYRRPRH